jgi:hypothetical protein
MAELPREQVIAQIEEALLRGESLGANSCMVRLSDLERILILLRQPQEQRIKPIEWNP